MTDNVKTSTPWYLTVIVAVIALLGGVWLGAVAFVQQDRPAPLVAPLEVLDEDLNVGGSVEYLEDEEIYILGLYTLPLEPTGSVYQVWVQKDDVIVSAGLWNSNSNRFAFAAYSGRYDTMFVTLEPNARGNAQPTTDPLIEIDLTPINDQIEDE